MEAVLPTGCTARGDGLAWDGIRTLPEELQLPRALKLTWAMAVEDYEKKYARYCHTIDELTAYYAKEGILRYR